MDGKQCMKNGETETTAINCRLNGFESIMITSPRPIEFLRDKVILLTFYAEVFSMKLLCFLQLFFVRVQQFKAIEIIHV